MYNVGRPLIRDVLFSFGSWLQYQPNGIVKHVKNVLQYCTVHNIPNEGTPHSVHTWISPCRTRVNLALMGDPVVERVRPDGRLDGLGRHRAVPDDALAQHGLELLVESRVQLGRAEAEDVVLWYVGVVHQDRSQAHDFVLPHRRVLVLENLSRD